MYGRNAVREALRAGRRTFGKLLVNQDAEGAARLAEIETLARERGVAVERVDRAAIDARSTGHHQGVLLEASAYEYVDHVDVQSLAEARAVILALDSIVDPQNVGTLLRTAEATGVAHVVIPTDRSAGITPAVVNASSGAVEHLSVTQEVNLARWLNQARKAGFWVVGLAGDEGSTPLFESSMTPPVVLVVGSEGEGLRRLVREACDALVSLPMLGKVESLNAAVAGSIGLYEVLRDAQDAVRTGTD